MSEHLTNEDKRMMRIMQDPVTWAETHLNQKPRWYQEQALRHPHNRIALRWGRRLGKCIAEGQTLVNADTGELMKVEDLVNNPVRTHSLDNTYQLKKEDMYGVEENGLKPVYEITLNNGTSVELTKNHPILTFSGWKEVQDIDVGDSIATPSVIPVFGDLNPREEYVKTLAYLSFAKLLSDKGPMIKVYVHEHRRFIEETLKSCDVDTFPKNSQSSYILDKNKQFEKILMTEDVYIPEEVFQYTREKMAMFIASAFDARGYVDLSKSSEINFTLNDKYVANQMKHLLLRFGIESSLRTKTSKGYTTYYTRIHHKVDISKFIEIIGKYSLKDYSESVEMLENTKNYGKMLPVIASEYVTKELKKQGKTVAGMKKTMKNPNLFRKNGGIAREAAFEIADYLEDGFLHDMSLSDISWKEVKSIEDIGEKMTYDVLMPRFHNLIVEDIYVHNTWTMVAHMLWAAFTNMGGKKTDGGTICVVAVPYDKQANLIYRELRKQIEANDILANSVKTMKQSPYTIEFKNTSEIRIFTTGAKTSSGGASIRGQAAD